MLHARSLIKSEARLVQAAEFGAHVQGAVGAGVDVLHPAKRRAFVFHRHHQGIVLDPVEVVVSGEEVDGPVGAFRESARLAHEQRAGDVADFQRLCGQAGG